MHEALASEAGIDGHDQQQVDLIKHVLDRFRRCLRVENDAGLRAKLSDPLQAAVQVRPGFRMNTDDVRTSVPKRLEKGIRWRDHEVHIERYADMRPDGFHDIRAERDVRYEVSVHHVDVQPVCPGARHGARFLAKPRK
eukprot:gene20665-biopygen12614